MSDNKIGFIKTDGGLKTAIDNKEIVPKNKITGPCVLIALAIATGTKISKWYEKLSEMKKVRGEVEDACAINRLGDLREILRELGWIMKKGDKRALHYSNIPKTGTVLVVMNAHACVVKDNNLIDKWDCRNFRVFNYWVKQD